MLAEAPYIAAPIDTSTRFPSIVLWGNCLDNRTTVVALLVKHRTCFLKVVGSVPTDSKFFSVYVIIIHYNSKLQIMSPVPSFSIVFIRLCLTKKGALYPVPVLLFIIISKELDSGVYVPIRHMNSRIQFLFVAVHWLLLFVLVWYSMELGSKETFCKQNVQIGDQ